MLTIEYAKNPQYAAEDGSIISLMVKFVEFADELPFGAANFDVEPHGVELFNRAKAGEFGNVKPFEQPNLS